MVSLAEMARNGMWESSHRGKKGGMIHFHPSVT